MDSSESHLDFSLAQMDRLRHSALTRAFKVLSRTDKRKLAVITLLQVLIGGLDLLGVLAIGLLGALSVTGLQSNDPGNQVKAALEFLQIESQSFQNQAIILGLGSIVVLVGRTILSIVFTRKTLFFLSRRGAKISAELISRLMSQPLLVVQSRSTQETIYALTTGVERIVLQVLATAVVWVSDLALLFIMIFGLLLVDPATAISTFMAFTFIGYLLYRFMHIRASTLGVENTMIGIKSNEKISEVFASYRESVVRNRRDYYAREIGSLRYSLASSSAELAFLPYVSKYAIETTVVVGALLIGAAQFIFQDTSHAVATVAIFLAAGSRIAPAVLRLQQGIINIKSGLGIGLPTLELFEALGNSNIAENIDDKVDLIHEGFVSNVSIENATLTYPGKNVPAVSNVSLTIPSGTSMAIVGPSGAGKTTMIDLLLGVLNPDQGQILISGLPPLLAVAKWPGAISYVPQDIAIAAGTIRENVALGYPIDDSTETLVLDALRVAHLEEFVLSLPNGIDTQVGERGAKLSGGQRQRLGIARAMFTRPLLLVLDEATSSLDGETEASISDEIYALTDSTTVVIIAHRLSTIRNADKVVYLDNGKVLSIGTFDQVRNSVADFDFQARIMGL